MDSVNSLLAQLEEAGSSLSEEEIQQLIGMLSEQKSTVYGAKMKEKAYEAIHGEAQIINCIVTTSEGKKMLNAKAYRTSLPPRGFFTSQNNIDIKRSIAKSIISQQNTAEKYTRPGACFIEENWYPNTIRFRYENESGSFGYTIQNNFYVIPVIEVEDLSLKGVIPCSTVYVDNKRFIYYEEGSGHYLFGTFYIAILLDDYQLFKSDDDNKNGQTMMNYMLSGWFHELVAKSKSSFD